MYLDEQITEYRVQSSTETNQHSSFAIWLETITGYCYLSNLKSDWVLLIIARWNAFCSLHCFIDVFNVWQVEASFHNAELHMWTKPTQGIHQRARKHRVHRLSRTFQARCITWWSLLTTGQVRRVPCYRNRMCHCTIAQTKWPCVPRWNASSIYNPCLPRYSLHQFINIYKTQGKLSISQWEQVSLAVWPVMRFQFPR